jgi:hypothetical protein
MRRMISGDLCGKTQELPCVYLCAMLCTQSRAHEFMKFKYFNFFFCLPAFFPPSEFSKRPPANEKRPCWPTVVVGQHQ